MTLIGHSMGGSVALLLVENHRARIERLIVGDTPPPYVGGDRLPARQRPDAPLPFDWPVVPAIIGQLNDPDPAWWDQASNIP